MRGSVWHIFNCPPPTWFCLQSLLYQNRSHKDNQPTGKNPASYNPHLMVRPSSNKALVDSPHRLIIDLYGNHHSYRIHRNKPLFPPVNCSVVKFRGNCHSDCIQCISTTDENKKFHYWHISWKRLFAISICFSSSRYGNASHTSSKIVSKRSSWCKVDIIIKFP